MSGLFGGALLTPQQRQEHVMRGALELRARFWAFGDNFVYRGAGDLLLKHGTFQSGRELPEKYQPLRGGPNECFRNSLAAVEADPSLRYVEGVYSTGGGHYTTHAWCIDPSGELLELTMPTDADTLRIGLDAVTMQPVRPLEHWGYWGIVFHPDYVRAVQEAQDHMNVLDRPPQDNAFAKFGIEGNEPRTDWPIYHYPYHPDRRTL